MKNTARSLLNLPEGLTYVPAFLPSSAQEALLAKVRELAFVHDRFRGVVLKRSYAQFGYAYVSTGRRLVSAPPFPPFLMDVVAHAAAYCLASTVCDQCIITHYPPGAGIGRHTDAKTFGDAILGVSLGGHAKLRFRSNTAPETTMDLPVAPGSLYVMQGSARWEYQHEIVPVKTDRYSITLREVTGECS